MPQLVIDVVLVVLVVAAVVDVLPVVPAVLSAFLLHDTPMPRRTASNNIFFIGLCLEASIKLFLSLS